MVKRKRVMLSYIPTDKNLLILQNMGFLDKRGRSTGRLNLNDFLNRAVHEKVGIDDPSQNGELLEKVIKSEIQAIQQKRSMRDKEDEHKLKELSRRLDELRRQTKMEDYYEGKD